MKSKQKFTQLFTYSKHIILSANSQLAQHTAEYQQPEGHNKP